MIRPMSAIPMLALATGLLSAAALAQSVPPPMPAPMLPETLPAPSGEPAEPPPMSEIFAELDRDKDGSLTTDEASRNEEVAAAFERLDESRDGRLDLAEFAQLRSVRRD